MLRYLYRSLSLLTSGLPAFGRAQVFASLAARLGAREILCEGQLGRFHGLPEDRGVFHEYLCSGNYSPRIHEVLGAIFSGGGTLIDVGANIGFVSVPVAKRYGVTCYAFEPEPRNHRLLVKNVAENDAGGLVRVYQLALASEEGTLALERSKDNAGDHRLRIGAPPSGKYDEARRDTVNVQVRRLDAIMQGERFTKNVVLKVDTQGAEVKVFSGAMGIWDRIDYVLAEYWPYGLRRMGDSPDGFFEAVTRFPFGAIIEKGRGMPRLAPTADVIREMKARVPADGNSIAHLDVLFSRTCG